MSNIAKNGFRAEKQICLQENVKRSLETYFKKHIKEFQCVIRKKYDILIKFEDDSTTTIQNKDGGGGRGWSVDRRSVSKYENVEFITLLNTLCLKVGSEKPSICKSVATKSITTCLLGDSKEERPQYFTHTTSDKISGKILEIGICDTNTLIHFITNEQYSEVVPKKTCVHLSPSIYLQRKGGGKTDHHPDDIQMKFKLTANLKKIFVDILSPTVPLNPPPTLQENHASIDGTNDLGTSTTILLPR